MRIENIKHFVFGYSLKYGSFPNDLLPSSKNHFCIDDFKLNNIYDRYDYFQKTTGLYVEINVPIVSKVLIDGIFNGKDKLTFERTTGNLFKCNQHFAEMKSLTDQNEYLIDLKFFTVEGIEKSFRFPGEFNV